MKKLFLLSLIGLSSFLTACGGQYIHSTEPRSMVYLGQPAADVYENFGMPTRIKKLNPTAQVLIYQKQEIEKDWSYRYFHSCEIQFYMVNDRVSDWYSTGDMCAIHSNRHSDIDFSDQDNGLLSYFMDSPLYQDIPTNGGSYSSYQVPRDAFSSSQMSTYEMGGTPYYQEADYGIFDASKQKRIGSYAIPSDAF